MAKGSTKKTTKKKTTVRRKKKNRTFPIKGLAVFFLLMGLLAVSIGTVGYVIFFRTVVT